MSSRAILVLALVALVAVQANSFTYAAKGGQFEQESVKAQPQQLQTISSEHPLSAPSTQQTVTTTTSVAQTETAPVQQQQQQQQQQYYGAPTQLASASSSVQTAVETAPVVSSASVGYPFKGQASYQRPAQIYSSKGGQAFHQQEQRLEAAPLKGQSFHRQPAQVHSSKGGCPTACVAGASSSVGYFTYRPRQPLRAPIKGSQHQQLVSRPVAAQSPTKA